MDQQDTDQYSWEPFVGRGALGGALGGFILFFLVSIYVFDSDNLIYTVILPGVFGPIVGLIEGSIVGLIVFNWGQRSKRVPDKVVRILIGVVCLFVYLSLVTFLKSGPHHYLFDLGHAALVGGMAGIMARPKSYSPRATAL